MDGRCTFCNAACLRLLGYAESRDLLGKNMHRQIHHSRADGSTLLVEECRIFQAFRKGEGTHVVDEVLWRPDGTSFPVEYWSYPVRKGEQVGGAVVTFVDISERKRAVEALRRSQERLWLALDAGRMGAWDWDIRTDKLVCSHNMEAVLQVAPGSFDGTFQAFQRLIHPVDRESVEVPSPVLSRIGRTTRSSSASSGPTARSAGCRARDGSLPAATGNRSA